MKRKHEADELAVDSLRAGSFLIVSILWYAPPRALVQPLPRGLFPGRMLTLTKRLAPLSRKKKVSILWHGMAWHGMAWHGMVWYGMVWYGMVWYGMV